MTRPTCAVGVMAYDEAGTIATAVRALVAQRVPSADVQTIAVVSSGSRDATDEIVRALLTEDPRLRLLTEPTRRGKISAVNRFLGACPGNDLYVITNGDVVLEAGTLERLLAPFGDPGVGMTGGRVVPGATADEPASFVRFANELLWALHHRIAVERPKLGETVAFRPVVQALPLAAVADEAYLEAVMHARGLRLVYVPDAHVYNSCPRTLGEFVAVRRRNASAHWTIRARERYEVATWRVGPIFAALGALVRTHWRRVYGGRGARPVAPQVARDCRAAGWLATVIVLEALARGLGILDGILAPERHVRWRIARSARIATVPRVAADPTRASAPAPTGRPAA